MYKCVNPSHVKMPCGNAIIALFCCCVLTLMMFRFKLTCKKKKKKLLYINSSSDVNVNLANEISFAGFVLAG